MDAPGEESHPLAPCEYVGAMTRRDDAEHSEQVEFLDEDQLAELEKRLAELDENPEPGESWETVRARILATL
jgi:putative addiction module component (TIGR02574 family)